VRRLAAEVLDRSDRLDVLVHCAGVVSRERQVSADGFELQWAVNHLAPFLLTHLLREYMGNPVLRFFESIVSISAERAGTHVVRLAADADVAGETGTYYRGLRRAEPSAQARDEALQERLWRVSARLTGVQA
jgi:NAD(P)-dependent dehydrogenase (short-subunit alcohol dehydrogenase family)